MKIECPRGNKKCVGGVQFIFAENSYICCGVNSKPSSFHKDIIWLCVKGPYSDRSLEMTPAEATGIISALSTTLFQVTTAEKKKLEE